MKKYSKILCSLLTTIIITTTTMTSFAATTEKPSMLPSITSTNVSQSINNKSSLIFDQIIKIVDDNSNLKDTGMTIVNEDKIIKDLASLDLSQIQKEAEANGVVFSEPLTAKTYIKTIKKQVNSFNNLIAKKELKVLKNGTVIDPTDSSFYIQGGSTYDITYWWGVKSYMSTASAWTFQTALYKVALVTATGGGIAGILSAGIGAVIGLMGSAYFTNMAIDVGDYNNRSSRGIIVTMNKLGWYSITTQ